VTTTQAVRSQRQNGWQGRRVFHRVTGWGFEKNFSIYNFQFSINFQTNTTTKIIGNFQTGEN
jgi:hypothetical protein